MSTHPLTNDKLVSVYLLDYMQCIQILNKGPPQHILLHGLPNTVY